MADQDEIAELKARIADLEARPSAGDLDWLKNSHTFKYQEAIHNSKSAWRLLIIFLVVIAISFIIATASSAPSVSH